MCMYITTMLPITTSASSLGYYAAAVLWHLRLLRWDFGTCFFPQQHRPDNLTRHMFCYKLLCFAIFKFILKHIWLRESTKPSEMTLSGTKTSTENSRSIIHLLELFPTFYKEHQNVWCFSCSVLGKQMRFRYHLTHSTSICTLRRLLCLSHSCSCISDKCQSWGGKLLWGCGRSDVCVCVCWATFFVNFPN